MPTLWSVLGQSPASDDINPQESMSLSDLVDRCKARDAHFSHVPLGPRNFSFIEDGLLLDGGQLFRMDQKSRIGLFEKLGAPAAYMAKHAPTLQSAALSAHAECGKFGPNPVAVLDKDNLVTIGRGDLANLANAAVVLAAAEELGREGERLFVKKIEHTAETLEIDLVSPTKAISIRNGDIVQAGISIVHARYGNEATKILAYIFRLVCSNGMVRRECVSGGLIPRARRLPANYPAARDLQMAQIRRLVSLSWNGLHAKLQALKETSEQPANAEELLRRWLQRGGVSIKALMPKLLAAWRDEGAENTRYGVVNALTRVATHNRDLKRRERRALASLAGLLAFKELHLCKRCWSVLAGPGPGRLEEVNDR